MEIEKKKLMDLSGVYVAECLELNNTRYYAVASENRGEGAFLINSETLEISPFWIGEAGVMNIVQIPFSSNVLCIDRFYPVFQSKDAEISMLKPSGTGYGVPWALTPVIKLPFCHRIGVFTSNGEHFLVASTLCKDKDYQEDWSMPGAVYVASITKSLNTGVWRLFKIYEGLTKNHGLYIDDGGQVYIASECGVMRFDFSNYSLGDEITPDVISRTSTSDVYIGMFSGKKILAAIEPFHGDSACIYEMNDDQIKRISVIDISFGHVIWTGKILGEDCFIVGNRGGERKLELYSLAGNLKAVIDVDVGPTQISVYSQGGASFILSANHGIGEVALYCLRK